MAPADLHLLKQYMHVDHDDDDLLIQKLWTKANRYLEKAGAVTEDPEDSWLAAVALTLQWYDGTPLPPGLQQVINQLKLDDPAF
jgi:hypothetical protein